MYISVFNCSSIVTAKLLLKTTKSKLSGQPLEYWNRDAVFFLKSLEANQRNSTANKKKVMLNAAVLENQLMTDILIYI
jgi:hypothetical protein